MTKFTAPQMSVIRFNESDVIVASNGVGKTMTILGVGDGQAHNATFSFNGGEWLPAQVYDNNSSFLPSFNSYFGTEYTDSMKIRAYVSNGHNGLTYTPIYVLAVYDDSSKSDSYDYNYEGTYTWNSSLNRFEMQ